MNEKNINSTALVLEGGGMRGVFTVGVLDYFMDREVKFPYVIGVSAGTSNALSYLAGQRGRALYIHTTLLEEHPYLGFSTLLRKGVAIDMDFLYNDLYSSIYPFDFDSYLANDSRFEIVTTNNITGEPCYHEKPRSVDSLKSIGRASCSLPIINRAVNVNGVSMYDGGLTDSIPLQRAFDQGYKRAVVVLTQNRGYRKDEGAMKIPKILYRKYPKVIELLNSRATRYNRQLAWIEELEDRGDIVVIRPVEQMKVGRLSYNQKNIVNLYNEGYEVAKQLF